MNVEDLKSSGVIPTLDMGKFMDNIMSNYSKYPKNSLSQREVVQSIGLDEMSFEEAQKIADQLNFEVTNTILGFQDTLNEKRSKKG